jgi:hypothetical protein
MCHMASRGCGLGYFLMGWLACLSMELLHVWQAAVAALCRHWLQLAVFLPAAAAAVAICAISQKDESYVRSAELAKCQDVAALFGRQGFRRDRI